jgi:hypothetical protein
VRRRDGVGRRDGERSECEEMVLRLRTSRHLNSSGVLEGPSEAALRAHEPIHSASVYLPAIVARYSCGLSFTRPFFRDESKNMTIFPSLQAHRHLLPLHTARPNRKVGLRNVVRHRGSQAGLVCPTVFVSSSCCTRWRDTRRYVVFFRTTVCKAAYTLPSTNDHIRS